jgi:GTPase SAR1 family protein
MQGITDIGIKDADAHMIVYSVTSQVSFNESEKYREKVKNLAGEKGEHICLCGNKCDAPDRAVTEKAGQDRASQWGCPFFETSAKENINIYEAFEAALKTLLPKAEKAAGKDAKKKDAGDSGGGGCCDVA